MGSTEKGLAELRVNGDRLWQSLMAMATIGATPRGGVCRLALSDQDKEARDLFVSWCRQANCEVRVDEVGNIFARRRGKDQSLPPVLAGSHLDTQPTGGKFDGALGVLAALEVVRTLDDYGLTTTHPVEIVAWTNEEGARFAPPMLASGVFAGIFSLDYAMMRSDVAGKTLRAELERIGYLGTEPCRSRPLRAYFELHIEQGPILEQEGIPIGVVTHAQGMRWYDVHIRGQEAHAGCTPLTMRRDALLAASRLVEAVNRIGLEHGEDARATVGMLVASPNSRNTVAGQVFIAPEFRHPRPGALDSMDQSLRRAVDDLARKSGVTIDLSEIFSYPTVAFAQECVEVVAGAAERCGLKWRPIISGAGHDACYLARVTPTGMIFVPCKNGISHNEMEEIAPAAASAGADVLLQAVLATANS